MGTVHYIYKDFRLSELDRRIIQATEKGLPLVKKPYHHIASVLGVEAEEIQAAMNRMIDQGVIRRMGAVPHHYNLGVTANGMTVWDVPDEKIAELGAKVGALDFVSHCYERPRHQPIWNYNLFAMVHGKDRETVEQKTQIIKELMEEDYRGHEILYSSKLLKKTGLRISHKVPTSQSQEKG